MRFEKHSDLEGRHAFLAPSNPSWLQYDEEKLTQRWYTIRQAAKGSELHAFASTAVRLGQKLPKEQKTLNMYVNDCIGFKMKTEVPLQYSDHAFGHADAIQFRLPKLWIFDLKNGVVEASFEQLMIYAALFCLEYGFKPFEIEIELRIYQNNECKILIADPDQIFHIMDNIVTKSEILDALRREELV